MRYLVAVERVSSGIGKKCLERLGLLFHRRGRPTGDGERLSPAVADQRSDSTVPIGEEAHRVGPIRSLAALSCRSCTRSGHKFPRAHKFVGCIHESTRTTSKNSGIIKIVILILIVD